MTADVIELDDHRECWVGGMGVCGACGALWPGVVHESRLWALECPRCHALAGAIVPNAWLDADEILESAEYAERSASDGEVWVGADG